MAYFKHSRTVLVYVYCPRECVQGTLFPSQSLEDRLCNHTNGKSEFSPLKLSILGFYDEQRRLREADLREADDMAPFFWYPQPQDPLGGLPAPLIFLVRSQRLPHPLSTLTSLAPVKGETRSLSCYEMELSTCKL